MDHHSLSTLQIVLLYFFDWLDAHPAGFWTVIVTLVVAALASLLTAGADDVA